MAAFDVRRKSLILMTSVYQALILFTCIVASGCRQVGAASKDVTSKSLGVHVSNCVQNKMVKVPAYSSAVRNFLVILIYCSCNCVNVHFLTCWSY